MEPSGEKPDLLPDPTRASHFSDRQPDSAGKTLAPPRDWTKKEKNDRSEWFLIAGFIAVVGFGVMGIGIFGLMFWISPGPDRMVDIFVCTMAILMGLFFLTVTGIGVRWLSRQKPGGNQPNSEARHHA